MVEKVYQKLKSFTQTLNVKNVELKNSNAETNLHSSPMLSCLSNSENRFKQIQNKNVTKTLTNLVISK